MDYALKWILILKMVNIKIDLNVSYVYMYLNDGLCVKEKLWCQEKL